MTPDATPPTDPAADTPAEAELTAAELDQVAGGSVLFPGGRSRSTVAADVGAVQGRESTQLGLSRRGGTNRR